MRILVSILFVIGFFYYAIEQMDKEVQNKAKIAMEYAYFQGQKDALEGKLNIEYDSLHEDYFWVRNANPWENGDQPTYDPQKSGKVNLEL